jgi:2,4-dienoyl-CoA reductase-like NADH-dependent reductase (Old Yellow Enzyme family)/NADPH-dependent 2,4-dienoyl-CoA reductase/sulfur reductase-like enzyme
MSRLLNQKGKIGNLELRNRMVMAPMGDLTANPDGTISDRTIEYYAARAKGGIGLIITGIVRINNTDGTAGPNQISLADDSYIPGFKKLVDEIHKHGAKVFTQIQHSGRQGVAALTGKDYVLAPSPIPSAVMQQPTRELTVEEIHDLVGQFGDCARRSMLAGVDGVEIHGAHGYLINQFLSPFSNKRTDEYGGSFENRMRFLIEIMRDVRAKTENKIPISVRISADEFLSAVGIPMPYIDIAEGIRIAKAIEAEGVEAINVSCGTYESMNMAIEPMSFPQGWRKDFVKAVKNEVNVPVIAVGMFREPKVAEGFLQEGVADFAAFGRALLADSEYANKVLENRDDEINRCISCLFCFDELNKGSQVVCAVNPLTGFECDYPEKEKPSEPKTVAIVGAGPAGVRAAIYLKKMGHNPVLFEESDRIGGQVKIGKNPPKKDYLNWFIEDNEKKLKDLGVDIRFGRKADANTVKEINPDAVLIAVGAKPIIPNIPGVDSGNVYSVEQVLSGEVSIENKTIAVIGSGLTGLEVAELLQLSGNKTIVVEMLDTIAPGAYMQNVMDVKSRLAEDKTEYLTSHKLIAIKDGAIELKNTKTEDISTRPVDAVVLSVGYRPDQAFIDSFKDTAPVVYTIGDADKVSNIGMATRSGFQTAYKI